jgi:hypothetical protein
MSVKLLVTPNGYKADKLYSVIPSSGSGDFTVVRNTTATRVNSSGLIEVVAANVPRLDYSNVTCPCILVEPQRTNLLVRSEEFDQVIWTKTGGTITSNAIASPDGTTTADELVRTGVNAFIRQQVAKAATPITYTGSIFLKNNDATTISITICDSTNSNRGRIIFDFSSSSITSTLNEGDFTATSGSVEDYGSGWYRLIITTTSNSDTIIAMRNFYNTATSVYIWGAQLEEASTHTSYIPTTSATVTRNEDVNTVTTPSGVSEIAEYFEDGSTNVITTIPVTYQMPQGRISKVVMT